MRSYQETLDYLFSRLPMFTRVGAVAFKKDLGNTIALCASLDNPQTKFKSIHIAGTNGKGSTSHILASVFQEAGYKTGLYTSPHLRDFRERIKINGEMISEQEVILFTERMASAIEAIQPSFFELTVAMAFEYFAQEKVDIAIIETGMGGRLDSTNIINPELSVITNIGFDHMEFLGSTLGEIAGEKAGIIKDSISLVIGKRQEETQAVFESVAQQKNTVANYAQDTWKIELLERDLFTQKLHCSSINEKHLEVILDLPGTYQLENIATSLSAIDEINKAGKYQLDDEYIINGLARVKANTGLMGRWQCLSENPLIICDTGHNEDGIRHVLDMLKQTPHNHLHFVIGMVKDKDIAKVLALLPRQATYYFTQAAIPRALEADKLSSLANDIGLEGNVYFKVNEALEAAKIASKQGDLIFVGGSTFVVAEVV